MNRTVGVRRGFDTATPPPSPVDEAALRAKANWLDRPAVALPAPPPDEASILACVYDSNGSRALGRLSTALVLAAACIYFGFIAERSVLIFAIAVSIGLYLFLESSHPPRAISAGVDWLSAVPAGKGSVGWVRTNSLAELWLDPRSGERIMVRDQHGRTLSMRLKDLVVNQLVYALFIRAVRQSHYAGMRVDETAAGILQLDRPVLGDEIGVDEDGRPKVTYFAVHLVEDGAGSPVSVIRRTPGDPLPIDASCDGDGIWTPDGYLYQFFGLPEGFTFSRITEDRALAFAHSAREIPHG